MEAMTNAEYKNFAQELSEARKHRDNLFRIIQDDKSGFGASKEVYEEFKKANRRVLEILDSTF